MRYALPMGVVLALLAAQASAKVVNRAVTYKHGDTTLLGYLAYDDAMQGRRPGVLVFPEWWGLTEFPRQKADQLARMGYVALAADMYGRGFTTASPQEAARLSGQFGPQDLRDRARAALDALHQVDQVDASRTAAIGFCFGGSVAQQLAYSGADLSAVVSFHGTPLAPSADDARRTKAQILILTGAADPMVPPQKLADYWKAMEGTGIAWQLVVYSDARHSFTNPEADKYRAEHNMQAVGYNRAAAERSWQAMASFLAERFGRPATTQTPPSGP